MGSDGDRVVWVDYAKGLCIIAVVALYATMYVEGLALETGWMSHWVDFARPVRMPAFFLLCGLFLSRTLDRPWRDYLDKKVVHFLYFFILWTTLYFAAGILTREFEGGAPLWRDYLGWYIEPFHMLWFIQMLPVYFIVTRLARPIPWVLVLAAAALLQIWGYDSGWRQLDRFGERFVYFYAGTLFAPAWFALADWARTNKALACAAIMSWGVVNELFVLADFADEPVISLVLGFAGAAGVIALASLLVAARPMAWLRYCGAHSIVIFLSFFFVVVIASRLIDGLELIADVGVQTVAVTALSVALPILAYWLVRRTPLAFLFARPRWAQLPRARVTIPVTSASAATELVAGAVQNAASVLPVEPVGPGQVGK